MAETVKLDVWAPTADRRVVVVVPSATPARVATMVPSITRKTRSVSNRPRRAVTGIMQASIAWGISPSRRPAPDFRNALGQDILRATGARRAAAVSFRIDEREVER